MRIKDYLMHLQAGEFYGIISTCLDQKTGQPKMQYGSEDSAVISAAAMSAIYDKDVEAYPCVFCYEWHIGRKMTQEERDRFSPDSLLTIFESTRVLALAGSIPGQEVSREIA
jgi:hypothetical protein